MRAAAERAARPRAARCLRRVVAPARAARARCLSSIVRCSLMPAPPFSASSVPRAASAGPPPPSSRSRRRCRGGADRRRSAARPPSAGARAARRRPPTAPRRAPARATAPAPSQSTAAAISATGSARRARARCASSALRWAIVSTHARRFESGAQPRIGAQRGDERLLEAVLGLAAPDRGRRESATRPRGGRRGSAGRGGSPCAHVVDTRRAPGGKREVAGLSVSRVVLEEARPRGAPEPPRAHQPPQRRRGR